eukprot:PhF_6_TR26342/c0_g1_i1/m.37899/K08824/CDKL; cyclin-dependent kinase-like
MEMYETLGVLGEGTYGVVVKARHKETQQLVAIKKFKESEDDEQVRKTSLREIKMLKSLRHFNIVNLLEVFRRKQKLYLVFEFIDRTILELVEKKPYGLDEADVKKYTYQLLRAVEYCHRNNVIHRDIKPENILIHKNGSLKLCDFGFARALGGAGAKYTEYVATRWYRSPELLVGDTEYSRPVDIWAIGCIFAEISNGMPLFPGESDIDQLHHIIRCFGRLIPRHEQIFKRNPLYTGIDLPVPRMLEPLEVRYGGANISKTWLQFLKSCLRNDPDARETCQNLLNHSYFSERGFKQQFEEELDRMERQEKAQNAWWASSGGKQEEPTTTTTIPQIPTVPTPSSNNNNNHGGVPQYHPPTTVVDTTPSSRTPTILSKPNSVVASPVPLISNPTPEPLNPLPNISQIQTPPTPAPAPAPANPTNNQITNRQPIAMFGTATVSLGHNPSKTPALGLFSQDFNVVKGLGKKNSITNSGGGGGGNTSIFPTLGSTGFSTDLKMGYKKKVPTNTVSPTMPQPTYGLGMHQGITGTTILHPGGSMKAPSTSHGGKGGEFSVPSVGRRNSKPYEFK